MAEKQDLEEFARGIIGLLRRLLSLIPEDKDFSIEIPSITVTVEDRPITISVKITIGKVVD